ncbi:hypothetical protein R3W88_000972 [Solanum pinnatisectum]|uniref:Uncharacterized protein n=1 Tax=Solanum pinnatisectum TaxID=50273 RepID=A0AAV9MGZ1_9SOLN|nr:hypothetical protein R3W88_000972 [Solanum pinnatisectum]
MAKCEGEHLNLMSNDDVPIAHFVPKQVRSRLLKRSENQWVLSWMNVTMMVTRSIKRCLEEGFNMMISKKPRCSKGKSSCHVTPIDIPDNFPEVGIPKKGQKKRSSPRLKKQVKGSTSKLRSKRKRMLHDNIGKIGVRNRVAGGIDNSRDKGSQEIVGEGDFNANIEDNLDSRTKRMLNFTQRSVIRGRVTTGFGGAEMGELLSILHAQGWTDLFLQGNTRRKMGKDETRYRSWPSLDGLHSALDIVSKFVNNPTLEDYTRVDKGAMHPLHKLLFDVVHKIILPRKQKRTEANYLDLTLMELLLSRHPINLRRLMLCHIHCIGVENKKRHSLGYGFSLGEIFEYFKIPVKEKQVQTVKDVLGIINQVVVPTPRRGDNASMQRLRAQLDLKDDEIAALRVSHYAAVDQLHVSYRLEHASLVQENSRLKDDLVKEEAALETEKSTNLANLKGIFDIFKTTPPVASPVVANSQLS